MAEANAPDKRALRILSATYWSSAGWRPADQRYPEPADLEFAIAAGVMFEPRRLSHDEIVEWAISQHASLSGAAVLGAFDASLLDHRLDLRSAFGSYVATLHLAPHSYDPWHSGGRICAVCGLYPEQTLDLSVLSFERFKWGGVRHLDPSYAAFDLEQFSRWHGSQHPGSLSHLARVVELWRQLPEGARAGDAAESLRATVTGNKDERRMVVSIAAIAGILQPRRLPAMTERYVTYIERNQAHPGGKNDWAYPAHSWTAADGVDVDAVGRLLMA